jgi:hypothetical protein
VKIFLTSAQIALILVYLVIFAGAFVRLTGSGMDVPIKMLWVLYPTNRATRITIRCWKNMIRPSNY